MGSFSIWHWVIVLIVVLVLFGGGGRLSRLMGDAARGLTEFKKGLKDSESDNESLGEAGTGDAPHQMGPLIREPTSGRNEARGEN